MPGLAYAGAGSSSKHKPQHRHYIFALHRPGRHPVWFYHKFRRTRAGLWTAEEYIISRAKKSKGLRPYPSPKVYPAGAVFSFAPLSVFAPENPASGRKEIALVPAVVPVHNGGKHGTADATGSGAKTENVLIR